MITGGCDVLQKSFIRLAHPGRIQGNVLEADIPGTCIGELCEVQRSLDDPTVIGYAQVTGFNRQSALLSLLSDSQGFSRDNVLVPVGDAFRLPVCREIAGVIMDGGGVIKGRLDDDMCLPLVPEARLLISGAPKEYSQRRPVCIPVHTGIRAIDALLTCGRGQRIGIFAAAGCGKTSLMRMLIEHSDADVFVIGLIGERGREVTEFVADLKKSAKRDAIVLVYASSDRSSVERCNSAQIATTVAEYYSSLGKHVMLFIDSITRYARALRDLALGMGELPARRGYPASVFEALPKLLERPGEFERGSITAFYTVLIESEEEADVIGDEVRSILDGHIYLSKKLASQGHYPAIDIPGSISRVFQHVTSGEHQRMAERFRSLLIRQRDMQLYLDLGEYRRGENPENDDALDRKQRMQDFLKQGMAENTDSESCMERLYECVAQE